MIMVPIIRVRDIYSGKEHIVGFDQHDSLIEGADGGLQYYNLQNGDGTPDGYDFVFEDDGDGGFNTYVKMVSVEEAVKLWRDAEKEQKENEEALKKMLGKGVVIMS